MSLKDRIHSELLEIKRAHGGRLGPDQVWQFAQSNPKSALHTQYNWDVQEAAEAHWRDVSQSLIKVYDIEYQVKAHQPLIIVPEFTSLSTERGKDRGSYEATIEVLRKPQKREQLLIDTINRLLSIKEVALFPELGAVAKVIAAAAEKYLPEKAAA
jgi:hypothetical protein